MVVIADGAIARLVAALEEEECGCEGEGGADDETGERSALWLMEFRITDLAHAAMATPATAPPLRLLPPFPDEDAPTTGTTVLDPVVGVAKTVLPGGCEVLRSTLLSSPSGCAPGVVYAP